MRIERHPKLNIWVREDGCVYLPQNYRSPAHWTFGCRNNKGYLRVLIAKKTYLVHRLVAETYLGEITEGCEIDHINRNKGDNRVENLRIVSHKENQRNIPACDLVTAQGRTHFYDDTQVAKRESQAHYYVKNKSKVRESYNHYRQSKRKTHRCVEFSDGSQHWVPKEQANELLKLPVKERVYEAN